MSDSNQGFSMTDPIQPSINLAFRSALIVLTQSMISLTQTVKQQMLTSVALLPEVSALQASVKALDPTFDDVFRDEKKNHRKTLDDRGLSEESLTALFDDQLCVLQSVKKALDQMG